MLTATHFMIIPHFKGGCVPSGIVVTIRTLHSLSKNTNQKTFNFKKANFQTLYNGFIGIDWSCCNGISDVNILCDIFYNKIFYVIENTVPKFHNFKRRYPSWYTKDIKEKYKLFQKYEKNNNKFEDPFSIATAFGKYFSSVFNSSDDRNCNFQYNNSPPCVHLPQFTEADIIKIC